MNYFQDCSTFQSEDSGIGLEYLGQRDQAWVVNSWQVDVTRYPSLSENVIIGTIPYEIKGFVGCRNFFMDTEDGKRLAVANSVWALINMKTGSPVRVTPEIIEGYPIGDKLPMDYQPRKMSFPAEGITKETAPIKVQTFHLDTNQHVNNNQYISIGMGCLRALNDNNKTPNVGRLRAEYKMQAHLGDVIYPLCNVRTDEGRFIYTVSLNDENHKPYCIIEVTDNEQVTCQKEEQNV